MVNILVTGANGQLGNELKLYCPPKYKLLLTDVEQLDITIPQKTDYFFKENNINFIINCAAYTAVDKAEEEYSKAYAINVSGIKNLTLNAKKYDIPLIHISTDYVFDGKNYKPYTESDKTNPQSIYGKTKLLGETEALKHLKTLIIRTSWLYSTFGNNFVKTILKLADSHNTLKVVFDQIGSPTYAKDLAMAIWQIVPQLESQQKYGIYNFSNEGVCSWYDFAYEILHISNKQNKILAVNSKEFPRPAPRPFYSVLDKTKIKSTFQISVRHWKDALKECLEFL